MQKREDNLSYKNLCPILFTSLVNNIPSIHSRCIVKKHCNSSEHFGIVCTKCVIRDITTMGVSRRSGFLVGIHLGPSETLRISPLQLCPRHSNGPSAFRLKTQVIHINTFHFSGLYRTKKLLNKYSCFFQRSKD